MDSGWKQIPDGLVDGFVETWISDLRSDSWDERSVAVGLVSVKSVFGDPSKCW